MKPLGDYAPAEATGWLFSTMTAPSHLYYTR